MSNAEDAGYGLIEYDDEKEGVTVPQMRKPPAVMSDASSPPTAPSDPPLSREQVEAIRDKYADKLEDVMWKRLCDAVLAAMDAHEDCVTKATQIVTKSEIAHAKKILALTEERNSLERAYDSQTNRLRALTEERDHYALAVEVAAEIMTTQQVAEATKRQAQRRAALEAEE